MKNRKEPHIALWIAIAVLSFSQACAARHEYLIHHQLREQMAGVQEEVLSLYQNDADNLRMLSRGFASWNGKCDE